MDKKEKKLLFEIEEIIVGLSAIALIISVFFALGPSAGLCGFRSRRRWQILICLGIIAFILLIVDQAEKRRSLCWK